MRRRDYEAEIKRLKERLQEQDRTIEEQDTKLKDLGKAFAEATKAPPEGCKKGNWCQACVWNKNIVAIHYAYTGSIGICMKGSCESFVQREETVSKK